MRSLQESSYLSLSCLQEDEERMIRGKVTLEEEDEMRWRKVQVRLRGGKCLLEMEDETMRFWK